MDDVAPAPVPVASWSHVLPTRTRMLAYDPARGPALEALPPPVIPRGAGRSFGDAAYVSGGTCLTSDHLCRVLDFDRERGTIECESGTPMHALHRATSGSGWQFPVFGGTRWATIGGAIGNDIHGKDHPTHGSFGSHVEWLELLTADGALLRVSPDEHADLFAASVGGLGLTGLIVRARLRLVPAASETVRVRAAPVDGLTSMRERFEAAAGAQFASLRWTRHGVRGLHYRATPVDRPSRVRVRPSRSLPSLRHVPPIVGRNVTRLHHGVHATLDRRMHVVEFNCWSDRYDFRRHLLGSRGFHEYQVVVPEADAEETIDAFYRRSARAALDAQFTVVKRFGTVSSPGLLSFPRPGYTMTTQLRNTPETVPFLRAFTDLVAERGGRVYLAKDSCITADQMARMYPQIERWREIVSRHDPRGIIQSDLARRLALKPW